MPIPAHTGEKLRLIQVHVNVIQAMLQNALAAVTEDFENDAMLCRNAIITRANRIEEIATALPPYVP